MRDDPRAGAHNLARRITEMGETLHPNWVYPEVYPSTLAGNWGLQSACAPTTLGVYLQSVSCCQNCPKARCPANTRARICLILLSPPPDLNR